MRPSTCLFRLLSPIQRTKAFVVDKPKTPFKLTPINLDEVRDDELLVEMKYSGICHTDIVLQQGQLPYVEFPAIFGHEGAGIVKAIGDKVQKKDLSVGDSVLLSFNTCGSCRACRAGKRAFCHFHPEVNHNAVRLSDRSTPASLSDGTSVRSQYFGQSSFSKHSVVHENSVIKCDYPGNLHLYAPLGCGFQSGAGTVLNVLKPTQTDTIAIFGMGGVGLAALMAAKYLGAGKIIAVDLVQDRLNLAEELGATHTINARRGEDIVSRIRQITGGGVTQAVDCTGQPKVIEQCIDAVGHEGVVVGVGVPAAGSSVKFDPLDFLLKNKTYQGLIQGAASPSQFLPKLIELHQGGYFPLERLCKTYPASQLTQAIEDMHQGKVIKPVISWEETEID